MLPEILELMAVERIVRCRLREVGLPTTKGPFLLCAKSLKSEDIRPADHVWNAKADVTEDLSCHCFHLSATTSRRYQGQTCKHLATFGRPLRESESV